MATITLNVEMRSGTGFGVWVTINNQTFHFTESGSNTITLLSKTYVATVGGHEPTTATVLVSFIQDGDEIAREEY
ncbi:MAG TPA: hypothetical protein VF476_03910, partial [Chitinophagaceae bacterium]